jgi:hypothetical protein
MQPYNNKPTVVERRVAKTPAKYNHRASTHIPPVPLVSCSHCPPALHLLWHACCCCAFSHTVFLMAGSLSGMQLVSICSCKQHLGHTSCWFATGLQLSILQGRQLLLHPTRHVATAAVGCRCSSSSSTCRTCHCCCCCHCWC